MIAESFELLCAALQDGFPAGSEGTSEELFSLDVYSRLCGQLDLCDIYLYITNPLISRLGNAPRLGKLSTEIERSGLKTVLSTAAVDIQLAEESKQALTC